MPPSNGSGQRLPGMPSKGSGLFSEKKKNPYKGKLARPKDVPLAKPEYTEAERLANTPQVINPTDPSALPTPQAQPVSASPPAPVAQQPSTGQLPANHPYSFIVNETPKRSTSSANAGGDNSIIKRVGVVAGGLLVLIIVFSVFKNLILPGPNLSQVVATFQRQQEILHVITNALQQTSLSESNKNFCTTAQFSMTSSSHDLGSYLTSNGEKLTPQIISAKISSDVDSQLTAAASNNQYNSTFVQVMQTQLSGYMNGLKQAITQDKGAKGQQLLRDDYNQAKLLLDSLGNPAS